MAATPEQKLKIDPTFHLVGQTTPGCDNSEDCKCSQHRGDRNTQPQGSRTTELFTDSWAIDQCANQVADYASDEQYEAAVEQRMLQYRHVVVHKRITNADKWADDDGRRTECR